MANAVDLKSVVKHIVDGNLGENLCRVCLLPFSDVCENIFTKICKEGHEYCIADVLETVCHLEFSSTDQYSVCIDCFVAASNAYKFYLLSQRSNEILDFYVDQLASNVASIQTPSEISDDYLCITLPELKPATHNFDYNIDGCEKESFVERDDILELNEEKKGKDDSVVIIVTKKLTGEPVYHKLRYLKEVSVKNNTTKEVVPKEKYVTLKKRRKREPMIYRKCSHCPVKYRFIAKLQEHMKLEHNVHLFVCKVCKALSEDEQEYTAHLKMHTKIHSCGICNAVFKRRESIITHLKWHEDVKDMMGKEGSHICEHCGVLLPDEEQLNEHYYKKHNKQHTCYYCGKMYRGEHALEMHIKKHELQLKDKTSAQEKSADSERGKSNKQVKGSGQKKRWICSTCGRDLVDERSLMWHTMLHTNERPYKCDTCGRGFVSLNRRNQHAVCAHSAPARRCPLCPALFHLRSMVNTHIKKVHLTAHKRRNRTSKYQQVSWRTEAVPLQELSVAVQSELLELSTSPAWPPSAKQCSPTSLKEETIDMLI